MCRYTHGSAHAVSPAYLSTFGNSMIPPSSPPRIAYQSPPLPSYEKEAVPVCRDFMNNMCNRGDLCKYSHSRTEPKVFMQQPYYGVPVNRPLSPPRTSYESEAVPVCRDFLNNICDRKSCKYAHPKSEPKVYMQQSYYGAPMNRPLSPPRTAYDTYGEPEAVSVCKDFLNNMCHRGHSCKFAHPQLPPLTAYVPPYEPSMSVPRSPPRPAYERETVPVCKDFLNNACKRQSCKYAHHYSEPKVYGQSYYGAPVSPRSPPRIFNDEDTMQVCRDFLSKKCNRESCKFAHPNPETKVMNDRVEICRDYRRGDCQRTVCRFYHPSSKKIK